MVGLGDGVDQVAVLRGVREVGGRLQQRLRLVLVRVRVRVSGVGCRVGVRVRVRVWPTAATSLTRLCG